MSGGGRGNPVLAEIEHIVVLMLENRSFDHMLGYLSLSGQAGVDGLTPDHRNVVDGRTYPTHHLDRHAFEHWEDPAHDGDSVAEQLADPEGGFVRNFIETRAPERREAVSAEERCVVMGYFDGGDLPVYDHLARHFLICDRWFSSVPGATWPNRCFAVAGESDGRKSNRKLFNRLEFPLYYLPAFVRHLDPGSWRWYSAVAEDIEPASLRLIDPRYLFKPGRHFAVFDRAEPLTGQPSFLDDAADGRLPSVAWIDPNFYISGVKNDDHPPSDVRAGQALVRRIANAVMEGPAWERTLLIITYDEHGGFFDHVPPPAAPDDRPDFQRYGVRVPALVVCPRVAPGSVSHETFDHTSIIKTVLERFAPEKTTAMGRRVAEATSLATVLDPAQRLDPAPVPELPGEEELLRGLSREPVEPRLDVLLRRGHGGVSERDVDEVAPQRAGQLNDLQLGLLAAGAEIELSEGREP